MKAQRGSRDIALVFLKPRRQIGVGGQRHVAAALSPRKATRSPLYSRLGRPHGRSERTRKISSPPGFDTRTVRNVASRYTGAHSLR